MKQSQRGDFEITPLNGQTNHVREPLIVAVIPAYNEEATISKVVMQAKTFVNKVIVCDDGSADKTCEIATSLGATVVKHERNLGYGAALSTLFNEAKKLNADVTVTLDADGQHDSAYIPKLIEPILTNSTDVVIGSRFISEKDEKDLPPYRKVGIRLITRLTRNASYGGITDAQSGFRAYSRKALEAIQPTDHGMGASTQILIKAKQANLTIREIPIKVRYDKNTSKENPIVHLLQVVLSTLKHVSIRRPQIFYAVPGLVALVVALGFSIGAGPAYHTNAQVSIHDMLLAVVAAVIGIAFLIMAIMLWMLSKVAGEPAAKEEQHITQRWTRVR